MSATDDLAIALLDYDGKHMEILKTISKQFSDQSGYVDALIALCSSENARIQEGASWLLKQALEQETVLSASQIKQLVTQQRLSTWPGQLHLCQCVSYWAMDAVTADRLASWLTPLLDHTKPFLRAWSVTALVHLAHQHAPPETYSRNRAQ